MQGEARIQKEDSIGLACIMHFRLDHLATSKAVSYTRQTDYIEQELTPKSPAIDVAVPEAITSYVLFRSFLTIMTGLFIG